MEENNATPDIEENTEQEVTKASLKPLTKKEQGSIRADKAVIDELKSLVEKFHFGNSSVAIQTLITDYELATAQTKIIDRQAEIDEFTLFTQKIREAYIKSLDMFQDVKEVVKSEFQIKLTHNEELIKTLRETADKWKSECEYHKKGNDEAQELLEERFAEFEKLEAELKSSKESEHQKNIIIDSLTKLTPQSEHLEATIKGQSSEIDNLKKQINQLEQQNRELSANLSKSEHEYISKAKSDLQELEASRKEVKELQQKLYEASTPRQPQVLLLA